MKGGDGYKDGDAPHDSPSRRILRVSPGILVLGFRHVHLVHWDS